MLSLWWVPVLLGCSVPPAEQGLLVPMEYCTLLAVVIQREVLKLMYTVV